MSLLSSREVANRTEAGGRQSVRFRDHIAHCHHHTDGLVAVVVTDEEYPMRLAYDLERQVRRKTKKVVSAMF